MRIAVISLIMLAAGFAAGYVTRDRTGERAPQRADRAETDRQAERREVIASLSVEERKRILERTYPDLVRRAEAPGDAESTTEPEAEAAEAAVAEEKDQIEEWLRSASSQWKAFAGMQAKNKVRGLLAGLGFDPETAKQIEAAIVADVERQVDRAIAMMLGEEALEESAFTSMLGIPPDLSTELERELGSYLSDEEIGAVRERVQGAHTKQMNDMADVQIATMRIDNLSEDQKTRLRDVFVGKDMMSRQMTQFAELTRNRKQFMDILQDEEALTGLVKKNMEPQRQRVRDILDDEQFKKYEAYEKTVLQQARMGMKMMSAMMKKPTKQE